MFIVIVSIGSEREKRAKTLQGFGANWRDSKLCNFLKRNETEDLIKSKQLASVVGELEGELVTVSELPANIHLWICLKSKLDWLNRSCLKNF